MGWERRSRGGRYYTRSTRVRGRIVREYVGGGLAGELAARQDAERRAATAQARATQQTEEAGAQASIAPLEALVMATERATRLMLMAAGYQEHRGEWRRRRQVRP